MLPFPVDSVILNIWYECWEIKLPGKQEYWQPKGYNTIFLMRLKGYPKNFYTCRRTLQCIKDAVLVRLLSQPLLRFVHNAECRIKTDQVCIQYEYHDWPLSGYTELNCDDLTENLPPALHYQVTHWSVDDDYSVDDQYLSVNFNLHYHLRLVSDVVHYFTPFQFTFAIYSVSVVYIYYYNEINLLKLHKCFIYSSWI